jgi:hypothetical protein
VSPLLANLFLHYILDVWLTRNMRSVRICRYADDGVIHCKSEKQAKLVMHKVKARLRECGLEMHPEKSRIVYCQDINRQKTYPVTQFTFLGYAFRPRKAVDKYGRVYMNFAAAVSREALTFMRQTVRGWHLQLKCDKSLEDLSNMFNPVLRGWANDYGRFHASAMRPLWKNVNEYGGSTLVRLSLLRAADASPRGQGCSPASPTGSGVEVTGPPRFLGTSSWLRALLYDPGGTSALGLSRASVLLSALSTASAPTIHLSGLTPTARFLAVYASQPGLPQVHARLASGWRPPLPGRV